MKIWLLIVDYDIVIKHQTILIFNDLVIYNVFVQTRMYLISLGWFVFDSIHIIYSYIIAVLK